MASFFHCESVSEQLVAKGSRIMWSVAESASCRNLCCSSYSFAVQLGRKFSVCVPYAYKCHGQRWGDWSLKLCKCQWSWYFKAAHEGFGGQIVVNFQRELNVQVSWASLEISACKYTPEKLSVSEFLGHVLTKTYDCTETLTCIIRRRSFCLTWNIIFLWSLSPLVLMAMQEVLCVPSSSWSIVPFFSFFSLPMFLCWWIKVFTAAAV